MRFGGWATRPCNSFDSVGPQEHASREGRDSHRVLHRRTRLRRERQPMKLPGQGACGGSGWSPGQLALPVGREPFEEPAPPLRCRIRLAVPGQQPVDRVTEKILCRLAHGDVVSHRPVPRQVDLDRPRGVASHMQLELRERQAVGRIAVERRADQTHARGQPVQLDALG